MFHKIEKFIPLIITIVVFTALLSFLPRVGKEMLGSLFNTVFPITITPEDLQEQFNEGTIKILLVPGHDNKNSGAQFHGVREADLNIAIAKFLSMLLKENDRFEVHTARDFETGNYTKELTSYFARETASIRTFRDDLQQVMNALFTLGIAQNKSTLNHSFAKEEVSLQLYGINKWANEQNIDIVLHIHINDYPRAQQSSPGIYTGFALYVPEAQYPNALASQSIATSILEELAHSLAISNLRYEREGIVEDQDLIAVGSNASREGVSLLIEYGYIYESQFRRPEVRDAYTEELAYRTYQGFKNYFEKDEEEPRTSLLPYQFDRVLRKGMFGSRDVLSLQAALRREGLYPPPSRILRECPINGNFGPCTELAVILFQGKYQHDILAPLGLTTGTGIVGRATLKKLNALDLE